MEPWCLLAQCLVWLPSSRLKIAELGFTYGNTNCHDGGKPFCIGGVILKRFFY